MTSSSAMQRRMAALFLLAIGLIAWQAPLTKPTEPPSSVQATGPGEQLYPIAVPDAAPIPLPEIFLESEPRAAAPARPAVSWVPSERHDLESEAPLPGTCSLWLRVSRYHWARRSVAPGELRRLRGGAGANGIGELGAIAGLAGRRTYHLAARDFADDDDDDGDPLDPNELRFAPPGAEVEVECSPASAPAGNAQP